MSHGTPPATKIFPCSSRTRRWSSSCTLSPEPEARVPGSGIQDFQRPAEEVLGAALHWIREEVDQIAMVQRSLLPQAMPEIPGVDLAARFEPFRQLV